MEQKQLTVSQTSAPGSESTSSEATNAGATALAPPPSENESVGEFFGREVERLPGVLRVERCDGESERSPTFNVYLRPDDRDTEYAVYELKGQVYDQYPEAYLDVVVLETTETLADTDQPGA